MEAIWWSIDVDHKEAMKIFFSVRKRVEHFDPTGVVNDGINDPVYKSELAPARWKQCFDKLIIKLSKAR